jgi:internalin A
MNKPKEILELERIYGITLRESVPNEYGYVGANCYVIDAEGTVTQLNLSHNQLTEIKGLDNFDSLQELSLSYNQLTEIKSLGKLISLQELYLSRNELTDIKVLENLVNLQKLYLSNNRLTDIKVLENLVGLQELNLSNNQLTDIKVLENLVSLQELNLSNNRLTEIKGIEYLVGLQELNLSNNPLSDTKVLENLVGLQKLDLSNNPLTEIKGIEYLVGLQELNLSNNPLSDTKVLENLVGLQELNLSNNQLADIKMLSNFVGLQELNLSYNQLTDIKVLSNFVGLQVLDLSNNRLTDIKVLENLVDLQQLDLSYNRLTDIKVLENLVDLQKVYLSNNRLTEIKVLENLVGLQELDLSYNHLSDINVLKSLVDLQKLNLSHNQLTDIKAIENLVDLQKLYLSHNQLTDIKSIKHFVDLQRLDLSNNQLTDIDALKKLIDYLNYLRIDNNPFLEKADLSLKEYENHRDIIQKYFSDLKQTRVEVTLPAKVMLLGNHASGKTTFRHYMLNGELTKQESTPILNIVPYPKGWTERMKLPEAILFDFGGQDYYHGLYQAFFSEDPIYMLFWCEKSNRNDVQQANDDTNSGTRNFTKEYWMRQLAYVYTKRNRGRKRKDSEEEDSSTGPLPEPLLLIQTYAEEEKETTDETAYGEEMRLRLKNTVGEFYISLNEKTGKDPLHKLQRECVIALLSREIEKKRKTLKKGVYYNSFLEYILAWDEKDYATLDDVFKKYDYEEENKDTKRTFLEVELEMLNRKGLVLYYRENEQLKDVVWLNPTKTVEYIHKDVLSGPNVKKGYNGIVPQEDFEKDLCHDEKIRELLKWEKVIFFDENNNDKQDPRYIIPGYLQLASEDKYYKLLNFGFVNPNFTLKFRHFIPFGLINQLICLYGGNPDYKMFWRDQLVFTYNGEYMLWIKLDFEKLTIAVYIRPQQDFPSKRQLALNEVEKMIYRNILDLYWGKEAPRDRQMKEHLKQRDSTQDIPKDMYLSVNGEDSFIRATDLEEAQKGQTTIAVYGFETEEKPPIPKPYTQRINLYKNFTDNEDIYDMKKIFVSFATEDEIYKNDFMRHTITMQKNGLIDKPFVCSDIEPSAIWDEVVRKRLNDCDIMICLVSSYFLNSDYINRVEVKEAMEQDKKLVPIVVRPCDWRTSEVGKFQSLGKGEHISLDSNDIECTENEKEGRWTKIIEEMRAKLFPDYRPD